MEFKGTKGPWTVCPTNEVDSHLDIAIDSKKSDCVCWVYSKSDYKELNGQANAKLISKAPEMLDMLKCSVLVLKSVHSQTRKTKLMIEWIEKLIKEATEI